MRFRIKKFDVIGADGKFKYNTYYPQVKHFLFWKYIYSDWGNIGTTFFRCLASCNASQVKAQHIIEFYKEEHNIVDDEPWNESKETNCEIINVN